jgi:hypothetical protein
MIVRTGAIDDVYRAVSKCDEPEKKDEGKKIVEEIAKLKYEVQHDRKLTYVARSECFSRQLADIVALQANCRRWLP